MLAGKNIGAWLAAGISVHMVVLPAAAAEPKWPSGAYKYITVDQPVKDALIELGRNIGVPVNVSKVVKGRLGAGMPAGTAREFLDRLCKRHGLVWHFDGTALNVTVEAETRTEMIVLDADTASSAAERLKKLNVADSRFPVEISQKDGVASVSGPPSYVALVKKALAVSPARALKTSEDRVVTVRVFRGKEMEAQNFPASKPQ